MPTGTDITFASPSQLGNYYELAEGQFPGWGWVDPSNDANAAEKLIDLSIETRRNQASQRGDDWDEIIDKLNDEEDSLIELAEKKTRRKTLEEQNNANANQ